MDKKLGLRDGTIYLVSGGAGAPLYTGVDPEWFGAVSNPTEHYIVADIGPTEANIRVIDLAGNQIDAFSIAKD